MTYAVVYLGRVIAPGSKTEMQMLYARMLKEVDRKDYLQIVW